jgi:glyoxylase-like metal-dependent hydrolase (beta-lactamase superfamily II)
MQSISRRGFVASAAAASAALCLDGPLEFIKPALAQGKDFAAQGFARFKVGDLTVTTIFDGFAEHEIAPTYIRNASVDDIKGALGGAEKIINPYVVTVVQKGDQTFLFDSGTGGGQAGGPKAGLMDKQNLKAAGIDPTKISKVIVTHFHADHISGLMAKDTNAQIYPNAEIIVPAAEYKYWTDPSLVEKLPEPRRPLVKRIQATLPTWKNIRQVEDNVEVAPGIRSVNTNGHTLGHTSYEITSGNSKLIVLGDAALVPALYVKNPGWQSSFDQDAALAEKNRRAILEQAVKESAVLTGYHWAMPGAGTIKKDGNGYAIVPVDAT